MTGSTARIDAHHHVWDLAVRPQTWMVGDALAPISRTFTVDELAPQAAAAGVVASVVVQTGPEPAETLEFLALAASHPLVAAVVGWTALTAPDVADTLAGLLARPDGGYLAGIRHQVHDEPDVDWLARSEVRRGIAAVGETGLVYDLLIRPPHLAVSLDTVRALPGVTFVVDHAAKPRVARGEAANADWFAGIAALGREPNVVCKLSGLLFEADWHAWRAEDFAPYTAAVLEAFGADRVMLGSDWPVCTVAGEYATSISLYDKEIAALSPSERDAVLAGTAARVYRLPG